MLRLLLAAVACALPAPAAQSGSLAELEAVYGRADAWTLALSEDGERLYLSEGAVVCVYSAEDLPPRAATRLAQIPIDASILRLRLAGERLYVAGGSHGLFLVDLAVQPWRAERVDDAGRKVCTDVVELGERVFATYAAGDASELRAYARDELTPLFTVAEVPGMAFDMAMHADHVYLALGAAGLGRVDASADEPRFERGPGPASFRAPKGFTKGQPHLRAIEVVGDRLLGAADICGLASVELGEEWSVDTPVRLEPVSSGGKPTYPSRIAVDGDRVVLGGHKGPVAIQDGAPITTYGALGFTGRIADMDFTGFEMGTAQTLAWFRNEPDGPRLEGVRELDGGWGDILVRGSQVWGNYVGKGKGFQLDDLATEQWEQHHYNPLGFAGVDGVLSGVREGALLFGTDSACSGIEGLPQLTEAGELRPVPGSEDLRLGFIVGPRWPGPRPLTEWVLGGHGFHWELFLLDWSEPELSVSTWALEPPLSPAVPRGEGRRDLRNYRGREFFLGHKEGDLLLLTARGTTHGIVGFSEPELTERALRTPSGKPLDVAPLFQVETQPSGNPAFCYAWRVDVYEALDGRRILALAAGMDARPTSATYTHPMLQLFELGEGLAPPVLVGQVVGRNPQGNLMGVRVAARGGRHYAIGADGGFGAHAFDVTVPEKPVLVDSWPTGPNVVDGHYDNVIDVDLWEAEDGRLLAYFAAVRLGVAVLDASRPAEGLEVLELIDTPGLAYGVHVAEVFGRPRLLVGDHQAGVRVYALGSDDE